MPRTDFPPHDPLNVPPSGEGKRKPKYPQSPSDGRLCGGQIRRQNRTCRNMAGQGTDHLGWGRCAIHGGATEGGRRAAAKDKAAELIRFYGAPVDTDPIEALMDEVRRAAGHVAFLGDKIANWPQDQFDENGGITPAFEGWVKLYQTERKQLVEASKAALAAGVSERMVQLAEHQGTRLADAVEAILQALQLSEQQWALVPDVVPTALRGLSVRLPIEASSHPIEGEIVP